MQLFYNPDIKSDFCTLNEEESQHCIRVLRMQEGDPLYLTDGQGNFYNAEIVNANAKKCEVRIKGIQREFGKKNFHIHMAVAPTKNLSRMEWFLEKATELGFDNFTPVICERSERKDLKKERMLRVVTAAMKQSLKAYLPWLDEAESFTSFISKAFIGQKFIAYIDKDVKLGLKDVYQAGNDAVILIGPEGDFSPREFEDAKNAGFIPINLGESRLRTETAALYACFMIHCLNTL